MARSLFTSTLCLALAAPLAAAGAYGSDSETQQWLDAFQGRATAVAAPADSCKVCFYQEPNYAGASFCVGKRDASCTTAAPISAPSTIGSVKFFTEADGCELVANVRVTVPPYDQRVDSWSSSVASTGYDATVQELFVEPAGRACFLATVDSTHLGQCYTKSKATIEARYNKLFSEVLLFKTAATDFYIVAYSNTGASQRSGSLSKRFTASSSNLTVSASGDSLKTLDGQIQSFQYVPCAQA